MRKIIEKNKPENFDNRSAINLASDEEWQNKNIKWWNTNQMEYDFTEEINFPKYTKEYYREIDNRFFSAVNLFMPYLKNPFDSIINEKNLSEKNVLEVGVGAGSIASLLSKYSKNFTGIDISKEAITNTSKRFDISKLRGEIIEMSAEKMEFKDSYFDFVWSWGVIHHSANTNKIINEISRVLKPKGKALIMVYHRSLLFYYIIMFLKGIYNGNFFKSFSIHKTVQLNTDGAIARFYSIKEWKKLVCDKFKINYIEIYGQHTDLIPLPQGKVKKFIAKLVPIFIMKFINTNLKQGYFLVSEIEKN